MQAKRAYWSLDNRYNRTLSQRCTYLLSSTAAGQIAQGKFAETVRYCYDLASPAELQQTQGYPRSRQHRLDCSLLVRAKYQPAELQ